ncbi:MAG: integration host factor, actinobacterial type [Sporichthyaceae bacterium]
MALPPMTPAQREAALAKAALARRAQTELTTELKSGRLTLAQVLDRDDPTATRIRVGRVLKALPGFGPVRVGAVLNGAKIDPTRRLGALTPAQRSWLLDATAQVRPGP